jgi:hypothetical protein
LKLLREFISGGKEEDVSAPILADLVYGIDWSATYQESIVTKRLHEVHNLDRVPSNTREVAIDDLKLDDWLVLVDECNGALQCHRFIPLDVHLDVVNTAAIRNLK